MKEHDDLIKMIGNLVRSQNSNEATNSANHIFSQRDVLLNFTEEEKNFCQTMIINFLKSPLASEQIEKSIFLLSIYIDYFYNTKIDFWIVDVYKKLTRIQSKNDFITQIMVSCFHRNTNLPTVLFDLFNELSNQLKESMNTLRTNLGAHQSNKVLISIGQVRGPSHSPTQMMLDLYHSLEKLGFEPYVLWLDVNSHNPQPFINFKILTGGPQLEFGPSLLRYADVAGPIRVYYYNKSIDDIDGCSLLLDALSQLAPKFMIGVGGFNVMQEALASYLSTAIKGTTTMIVPTLYTRFVHLPRSLTHNDMAVLKRAKIDSKKYKKIIRLGSRDEKFESEKICSRQEFNLPEGKILLAIAGNRLQSELGDKEFKFIKSALALDNRIVFLVIGKDSSQLVEKLALSDRLRTINFDAQPFEELGLLLGTCDYFINLDRWGGGTCAILALARGTLVLSYMSGDVAELLPTEYLAKNYGDLLELIRSKLDYDKSESKDAALRIYKSFPDFDEITKSIVEELCSPSSH